ncbi:uncharacterized protein L969DRAFT_24916 [Mixia osmundae IAM 14324]|uniref:Cullin family profile domain-containing protein n=1 Tax=Mixia osmundae (strain CBS 9802 / IAM 14324 / JCM 22182 / KY 12970) TaxID=764103 RepID=G7E7N2_MIXOS|nr:uncharacterized protein L969DRAFT_24916 [Mixia osmundae IAM 14324]KEI38442.1 hypothetical protein L969DRAFT_24916 [Mixia osmundae IAM 14324]GAA98842.1 hypothetical protein E5Q_05530 [Mixia osmundae IAM 14324]
MDVLKRPRAPSSTSVEAGAPSSKLTALGAMPRRIIFRPTRSQEPTWSLAPRAKDLPIRSDDASGQRIRLNTSQSRPDNAFYQRAISRLVQAARAILNRQVTSESLQSLYQLCRGLVSTGPEACQTLYDRLRIEIERAAGDLRKASIEDIQAAQSHDGPSWLTSFESRWKEYLGTITLLRDLFLYLDRAYLADQPGLLWMWELGQETFNRQVLEHPDIVQALQRSLIDNVNDERSGKEISRRLVASVITLLQTHSPDAHRATFVMPFLESSTAFYREQAAGAIAQLSPAAYLAKAVLILDAEQDRADNVVGSELKAQMVAIIEEVVLRDHLDALIANGLATLIEANDTVSLGTLYSIAVRVRGLDTLRAAWLAYIKSAGFATLSDPEQDEGMITRLLGFRTRINDIVAGPFTSDLRFSQAARDGFEEFVNKRQNKPAEMIAKFIDAKMRSGSKAASDDSLEEQFDQVLDIFRFTQGKDIFEAFYKRDFAKRLLLNRSASSDIEKSLLAKLKNHCGAGFTASLETMARDIDISSDLMKAWKMHGEQQGRSKGDLELSVNVLTSGNWPSFLAAPVRIDGRMAHLLDIFKQFYAGKHGGRTLSWQHSLDQCTLTATFPQCGKRELLVSLFQAIVLLQFNEVASAAKLSYEELVSRTGLEKKEAARVLQSLACGKSRVLVKFPKGKDVNAGDQFAFNEAFKDDHYRIKINQIQMKETAEENQSTTTRVFLDRQSHLQLCIVRLMKSRKTIKHAELIMDVVNELKDRFKVETQEIKKAIDSLIEREYMERVEGSRNTYSYVA